MLKYDHVPGTKGTFIFVHGAGGKRSKWHNQMAGLAEGYGGLAFDLTGHGESGGETPTEIKVYAEDLITGVQEIAPVKPWIWVGHSMGGGVILTVALTKPELADYLVLIGTGGRLRVNPAVLESLKNGIVDPAMKRLNFSPSTPDDLIDREIAADLHDDPQIAYNGMLACDKFDIMDQLPSINIPACIIVGQDDISTPPKYAEFMLKKLPQGTMTVIEKAGHLIMVEQPEAVNKCMQEFIAKYN